LSGSIGCGALGVSGGIDSVIRVSDQLQESVSFPDPENIIETISESVSVVVT